MNRQITGKDRLVAERLRRIWNRKKVELDLTQKVAAQRLSWTQSVISQYLNCHIALNTDAVFSFAELLQVPPEEIDPALKTRWAFKPLSAPIKRTPILGELGSIQYIKENQGYIEVPQTNPDQFAVRIHTSVYKPLIKPGHFILVEPTTPDDLNPGDYVLVFYKDKADIREYVPPNHLAHIMDGNTIQINLDSQSLYMINGVSFRAPNPLDADDSHS